MGDIAWGTHFCHFFETTDDLCDTVVPYFIAGLEQRELCFWLLDDLTPEQCIDEWRRRSTVDLDRQVADGNLLFQAADAWYRREGVLDVPSLQTAWDRLLEQSQQRGLEGVRVAGCVTWLKTSEWDAFARYERDFAEAVAGKPMIVLCSYPLATTSAAGILDVAHTHDFALAKREGMWDVLETPVVRMRQLDIRNRQRSAVAALGLTAVRDYDLQTLFAEAARLAAETLGTGRSIVWQLRPGQDDLILRAHAGWNDLPPGATIPLAPGTITHYAYTHDEPVVVVDVDNDARFVEKSWLMRQYGVATLLTALVRGRERERPWGALSVHSTTRRAFTADDVEFVQSMANVLALAIERNDHELAERREKEVLQTVVDNIPVMIMHDDAAGRIIGANPEWERTLGWTAAEARRIDILAELFPDPERLRSAREFVYGAPDHTWRDFELRTRDGSILEVAWARFGLSDGSSMKFGIDLTERKRAEERFRMIAENIDETFCVFSADLQYLTYLNPAGERLLGRTLESLRGHGAWLQAIHPDDRERALHNMAGRRSPGSYDDCRIVRPDGSMRWMHARMSVILGAGDDTNSICVVMQDVTERRQAEQRLESLSRRLLTAQEEERRRLAIELHDELGQILTAAKIDLGTNRLDDAIESVDRAMRTVRDLALELRPAMLDDLGLAAALRWYADRFARQAHVEMHLALAEVPRLDPGVATACFRVAQESLTNVVRHARAANVWIELRHSPAELGLTVRDDGIGFDVLEARERAARGASLGLIGMEERVLLAGGFIEIHSAPGQGTTVRAVFPCGGGR